MRQNKKSDLSSVPINPCGFSLIELLVVIAIVGVLMSVLIPVVNRGRQAAKSASCQANVRRFAAASLVYANDNRRCMPPHRLPLNKDKSVFINEYGRKKPRWQWFLNQECGPVIDPNTPNFDSSLTMTNHYFLCPAMTDQYADNIRNGAYGYNHAYLGSGRPRPGTGNKYVPFNFPVRFSRITAPARTVMFGDSRGAISDVDMSIREHAYTLDAPRLARQFGFKDFGPKNGLDSAIPVKWKHSPAHDRHLELTNISFVDTHVQSMTIEELGYQVDDDDVVIRDDDNGDNQLWTGNGQDEPTTP